MKKLFGKLHLWLGLASGLIVFIISLTGCLYVFEEELQAVVYQKQLFVTPQARPILSMGQVASAVDRAFPDSKLQRIFRRHDPDRSFQVTLKDKRLVSIDPYTGAVLGVRNLKTDFFALVREMHTSLMLGKTGSTIIGYSVLIYLFLLVSGLVLWWPRCKTVLKQRLTIKWNARWRRVNYDWHAVGGFYATWLLLVIAMTGLIWAFDWWENGLYALTGSPARDREKAVSVYQPQGELTSIDKAYAQVLALEPNSFESYVIFPADSVGALRVQVRYDQSALYRKYTIFYFDQYSGARLKGKRYQDFSRGDVARGAAYDLHTGGWLGLPGKILAFLASLFSASLPVSGFLIWWGKRKKQTKSSKTPVERRQAARKLVREVA